MVLENKTYMFNVNHKSNSYKVSICIGSFSKPMDINSKDYMNLNFLHKYEKEYLNGIKSQKRLKSFILGRYTAKKAISNHYENINLESILIKNGIFRQPILEKNINLDVSISHCDDYAVSMAFDRQLIFGIDIEKYDENKREILEKITDSDEVALFDDLNMNSTEKLISIWVAKEALSKCLKTGISVNLKIFKISKVKLNNSNIIGEFLNFPQYKFLTFRYIDYILAMVFPKNLDFQFDIVSWLKK